jgi:hypothetical protein
MSSRKWTKGPSRFVSLTGKARSVLTILKSYMPGLPVVSFRFSEQFRTKYPDVNQKWIQTLLRAKGWIVPNYELPPDLSEIEILRVVVRETVSEVLVERLVADIVSLPCWHQSLSDFRFVDRHHRISRKERHTRSRSQCPLKFSRSRKTSRDKPWSAWGGFWKQEYWHLC